MRGIIKRLPTPQTAVDGREPLWPDCKRRISDGAITPIISNCITAALFDVEPGQLAREWARDVGYPLTRDDSPDIARVAQFHSVHLRDPVEAKRQYLETLKGYLVAAAEGNADIDQSLVAELRDENRRQATSFSELAYQLGYPCYREVVCNPLRLLAELPLPLYVTTCHHRFLEHALLQTGSKTPVTEILYWHDGLKRIPSIFSQQPDYIPSVDRPLVYHLFGLDDYPESLVLTEDDHLDFLLRIASLSHEVKHAEKVLDIPSVVSMPLAGTALLLLGFHVYDWDFRVVFKGLVQDFGESRAKRAPKSIIVQVVPQAQDDDPSVQGQMKAYLAQYFEQAHFSVYWGDMGICVQELWQLWKGG